MDKEYKFKTIQEITEAITKENIEVFCSDFKEYLEFCLYVKEVVSTFNKNFNISNSTDTFHWKDDGKKGVSKISFDIY